MFQILYFANMFIDYELFAMSSVPFAIFKKKWTNLGLSQLKKKVATTCYLRSSIFITSYLWIKTKQI